VATVGRLSVEPGAVNVIPGSVRLTVDARAPDAERLTSLLEALDLEPGIDLAPVELDPTIRGVLREEVERLGLQTVELPSGAGHDAGVLAADGVAAGMLFVRSLNGGVSHSPDELTSDEDIALAVDVLTVALRRLAAG
jgi:acetylornithine deacetylase/succinyl-diaminopimelate desuccinylase-like protein